jgi:CRISPR/Cas system-associated exonuclease Cas4 (RecB family)
MNSWSVSSIKGFHTCQLQWYFRRQGLPEEFRALPLVEGIVVHAGIEAHLKALQAEQDLPEEEAVELLDAVLFEEEMKGEVRYGKKTRDEVLERLVTLFKEWAKVFKPGGEIVAVESEVRAHLPGIDLPLLGYADLIVKTEKGLVVTDFKTTASKPYGDDLFDPLDLQRLAMTHGVASITGEPVVGWRWVHLVKTVKPQIIDDPWEVSPENRVPELDRLRAIVNPSIAQMKALEDGRAQPVPNQSWFAPCSSCGYRMACAKWTGTGATGRNRVPPTPPETQSLRRPGVAT